jgi:hypothetical protein
MRVCEHQGACDETLGVFEAPPLEKTYQFPLAVSSKQKPVAGN